MYRLDKDRYDEIKHLVDKVRYNNVLMNSVIECNSKGCIYVDNLECPSAAYIEGDFLFLIGNDRDIAFEYAVVQYINNNIIQQEKELILFIEDNRFEDVADQLKQKGCKTIQRKMFTFDIDKYSKMRQTIEFDGINIEKFMITDTQRFGFRITNKEQTISECTAVAVGGNEAEIDINTSEVYRRQGYATKATIAFIDFCLANNIVPSWSCWPFRIESANMATKLGFSYDKDIPVIFYG